MSGQKYLIENLSDYNDVFEVSDDYSVRCSSSKTGNVKNFVGEYAKEDLDKSLPNAIGEFSPENNPELVLPVFSYKSHSRFSYAEKGYVKCRDSDQYIVLLKNVLAKRLLWIFSLLLLSFVSFLIVDNIIKQNNASKFGSGTGLTDDTVGILVPVFKELKIEANKTNVELEIENPMEKDYYCKVSITMNDGQSLYSSDMLEPGKVLTQINLSKSLGAGSYEDTKVTHEYFLKEGNDFTPLYPASIATRLVSS